MNGNNKQETLLSIMLQITPGRMVYFRVLEQKDFIAHLFKEIPDLVSSVNLPELRWNEFGLKKMFLRGNSHNADYELARSRLPIDLRFDPASEQLYDAVFDKAISRITQRLGQKPTINITHSHPNHIDDVITWVYTWQN